MIVELSDTENPSVNMSRKTAKSYSQNRKGTSLLKTKQTELDLLKKRLISIYSTPNNLDQKSMKIFLKLQQRIKESFIQKCLDKIKARNAQSQSKDSAHQDSEGDQMNVDFLLSIYSNLDTQTNLGDSGKDEIIKNKIQETIIER